MPILFQCPRCKARIKAPDMPGRQVRCSECKQFATIPRAEEFPPVEVAVDDDDEAERDEPPAARSEPRDSLRPTPKEAIRDKRRKQVPRGRRHLTFLNVARVAVWAICILVEISVISSYTQRLPEAKTAIQEAVLAADACVWLIFVYVLSRALGSIFLAGSRW